MLGVPLVSEELEKPFGLGPDKDGLYKQLHADAKKYIETNPPTNPDVKFFCRNAYVFY